MLIWGLVVQKVDERLRVVAVELSRTDDAVVGIERFRYSPSPNDEWPQKLAAIRSYVKTELATVEVAAVVVRTLEKWAPPRVPAQPMVRMRYQVEGVLLELLHSRVPIVAQLSGHDIGTQCGSDKDAVLLEAKELLGGPAIRHEAGAAALAALALASAP